MRIASKSVVREPRLSKLGLIYVLRLEVNRLNSQLPTPNSQKPKRIWELGVGNRELSPFRQHGHPFVSRGCLGLNQLLFGLHQLDVEAQRLELADEDVERFRQARLERRVALDDRL